MTEKSCISEYLFGFAIYYGRATLNLLWAHLPPLLLRGRFGAKLCFEESSLSLTPATTELRRWPIIVDSQKTPTITM